MTQPRIAEPRLVSCVPQPLPSFSDRDMMILAPTTTSVELIEGCAPLEGPAARVRKLSHTSHMSNDSAMSRISGRSLGSVGSSVASGAAVLWQMTSRFGRPHRAFSSRHTSVASAGNDRDSAATPTTTPPLLRAPEPEA